MKQRIIHKLGEFQDSKANEIDLVIRIGDSNENGALEEPVGMNPDYLNIPNNVLIYFKVDREYSTDNATWQKYSCRPSGTEAVNRAPGYVYVTGPPYGFGTDQSFVRKLSLESHRHVAIIKIGKGGSTLIARTGDDNDWAKGGSADAVPSGAELYTSLFFIFLDRGLRDLRRGNSYNIRYGRVRIKAAIIRLGTNDCKTANWNSSAFTSAIPAFVNEIRAKTRPDLPIYWVLPKSDLASSPLGEWTAGGADVTACRTAITNCTAGGSTEISNFFTLNYDSHTLQADGVHYDYDSYVAQGEDEADLILGL